MPCESRGTRAVSEDVLLVSRVPPGQNESCPPVQFRARQLPRYTGTVLDIANTLDDPLLELPPFAADSDFVAHRTLD
jgi:hypothetical protein